MAISSSSRGLRPGVCTSTTRPANPYDGMVIYETDTDKVAVYDVNAWVYKTGTVHAAPVAPGLVFISSTTCVNSLATQINNCFSSTYDNYTIQFTGITGGSSYGSSVQARLGTAGTPDTGSGYKKGDSSGWGSSATQWSIMNVPNTAGLNMSFTMTLYVPNQARPTSGTGEYLYYDSSAYLLGFYKTLNTQYTDFTLITPSFTGGSIKVYGWQKS